MKKYLNKILISICIFLYPSFSAASEVNLICKYQHHLWVDTEKTQPPWGLIFNKKVSTNQRDTRDISINIPLSKNNKGTLNFENISRVPYKESGNFIKYELQKVFNNEVNYIYYYSLDRVSGQLEETTVGLISDMERCKKFIDCDNKGFATLLKKYYQCQKIKKLF